MQIKITCRTAVRYRTDCLHVPQNHKSNFLRIVKTIFTMVTKAVYFKKVQRLLNNIRFNKKFIKITNIYTFNVL